MKKIIRITTVPGSLKRLLKGQLKFMNHYYEIIGVSSDGAELMDVAKQENIRVQAIEMTRTISPFKDLIATYKLYKFVKKEQPFIVHTHTPKAGILGMLASKLAGVEHRYHTVAGMPLLEASGFKRRLLNLVEKATYSLATKVFPNSKGLEHVILESGYTSKQKLKVIGKGSSNGINLDYFSPSSVNEETIVHLRAKYDIKEEDFIFIFVGRLVTDKGLNELVSAFNEISDLNRNCKLLLVGGRENDLDPLKDTTETILNTNPNIIQTGFQQDVRPFMSIAHILTFPSYREGFPNVVLQAGAMELPAIVTNINGCNEIVRENFNGFIINPKSKKELKDKMIYALNNQDFLKEMGKESRQFISKNFDHEYIWSELLKIYQQS